MIELTEHEKFYWKYEYDVVAKHLVPLLESWGTKPTGAKLLDVGCGDGGGLAALFDAGMICKGYDIEPRRVERALQMNNGRTMTLTVGNIYNHPVPFANEKFDLVILHDVFEHLEYKEESLRTLKSYLVPEGKLLISFPPYYSAFGGHQQLMQTWFARLPFVHLMPLMLTKVFPRLKKEHKPFVEEIQKLGMLKMSMHKFEQLLPDAGLRVVGKQAYLISPNHIRFGLKPMRGKAVAKIPLLGELLISGVVYLLSRN